MSDPAVLQRLCRSGLNARKVVTLTALLAPYSSVAAAQYSAWCAWTNKNVPVYYNPGPADANGFSSFEMREDFLDAIAIWNEESQSKYNLYYAGDTARSGSAAPGTVLVENVNRWFCADQASGKAFGTCDSGVHILIMMQDSCTGQPRRWRTGFAPPPYDSFALSGNASYEHVVAHELGHALALPDTSCASGIMCGPAQDNHSFLHLYPTDSGALIAAAGRTDRQPRTTVSSTGATWSSVLPVSTTARYSTVPPSLDCQGWGSTCLTQLTYPDAITSNVRLHGGNHGGWYPGQTLPPIITSSWASVAVSRYAETMVVSPSASCTNANGCDIDWAWSNDGVNWTTGTVDADTFGRPTVDYAPPAMGDRFVLAYINRTDARVLTRSIPAFMPTAWTAPVQTMAAPVRYLGGIAFSDSAGLLLAADGSGFNKGRLSQFDVVRLFDVHYALANPAFTNDAFFTRTRRPFGVAHDAVSGRTMVAYVDPGIPRPLGVITKFGLSSSSLFGNPTWPILDIVNGADIAFKQDSSHFVVGISQ